jgi:glutamyl-Q tRNA(Asp) synthetase
VRIEDIDTPRCVPGAAHIMLAQLAACRLQADEPVQWQSNHFERYDVALQRLTRTGRAYPCACSRKEIEAVWAARRVVYAPGAETPYPGTCRPGLQGKPARAWRLRADGVLHWQDRRLGAQQQDVAQAVGDFVLQRADGLWAYQLAVVVDDAAQRITHVVRGEDLADNTARQILLQRALSLPTPVYLHTPLVLAADGHKLSKQNGAVPVDVSHPVAALQAAALVLGLPRIQARSVADWLAQAVPAWAGIIASFSTRST